jgi:hypothetical protein
MLTLIIIYLSLYYDSSIQTFTITNDNLTLNLPVLPIHNEQLDNLSLNSPVLDFYNEQLELSPVLDFYDEQLELLPINTFPLSIKTSSNIPEQTLNNLINPPVQNSDNVINVPETLLQILEPVPGMRFESWTELDRYLDVYCNSKYFSKIIYGAEYDNGIRRRCRYKCEYQGNYQGKKNMIVETQRNTRSKRSGCPWFINATCPKSTGIISITTMSLEHGDHLLDPLANKFGITHRTLTEPMLADIEFWTTKGNLSMRTQRQLLEAKYENVFFLPQDLSNAIQKVKIEQRVDYEAATLINDLIEHKF